MNVLNDALEYCNIYLGAKADMQGIIPAALLIMIEEKTEYFGFEDWPGRPGIALNGILC